MKRKLDEIREIKNKNHLFAKWLRRAFVKGGCNINKFKSEEPIRSLTAADMK